MNKLISNINGGYPFVMDDLRFMDQSYRDAFKGTLHHLQEFNESTGNVNAVGIAMIPSNDGYSGGATIPDIWVFKDGEYFKIKSQQLDSGGGFGASYTVQFPTTYDSGGAGTKTFQDGNTHETYQIREATILKETVPMNGSFVLFYWTGSKWSPTGNTSFQRIQKKYLGLDQIESDVTDNTDDIATNGQAIQGNTQQINFMTDSWISVSASTIVNNIRQCETTSGGGQISSPDTFTGSGSFLRYKLIGKTLLVNFNFADIQLTQYDDYKCGSIRFSNLMSAIGMGSHNLIGFYGYVRAVCTAVTPPFDRWQLESGMSEVIKGNSNKGLVFRMVGQRYNTSGYWNRIYNLNTSNDLRTVSATNDVLFMPTYTIRGTLQLEID